MTARLSALALLAPLLVGGCGDKQMTLSDAAIAKESSLEVRIGGAGERGDTTVGLQAMIMPGVALLGVETNTAGVTSTKPEKPVEAAAVQAAWAPLMNGAPKQLPAGEGFSLVARLGGKTVMDIKTTVAGARGDANLLKVVDKLLALAATTHAEQAGLAGAAWRSTKAP